MAEEALLDTIRRVATPEGCELDLRLAGPVVRARAWLIDAAARGAMFVLALLVFGKLGNFGYGLFAVTYFAIGSLYPILFEALWNGQTPGKRLSGLVVLRDDGSPVDWNAATARNLMRFVDALPIGYAAALATIWISRDGRRLGDILAGTVVAYAAQRTAKNDQTPQPATPRRLGLPEAPPFPLLQSEQQALMEFHQRSPFLTDERAEELAVLAVPLTEGLDGPHARARLLRIAEHQMGASIAGDV